MRRLSIAWMFFKCGFLSLFLGVRYYFVVCSHPFPSQRQLRFRHFAWFDYSAEDMGEQVIDNYNEYVCLIGSRLDDEDFICPKMSDDTESE